MNAAIKWFRSLERREQQLIGFGGIFLVIFAIYSFAWVPLSTGVDNLRAQNENQREILQWMSRAATEARQLRQSAGNRPRIQGGQSMLAVVDRTTQSARLAPAVKRIQPKGQKGVQVRLENAAFDSIVLWLTTLQTKQGIMATMVNIERTDTNGLVNARLTLEAAG